MSSKKNQTILKVINYLVLFECWHSLRIPVRVKFDFNNLKNHDVIKLSDWLFILSSAREMLCRNLNCIQKTSFVWNFMFPFCYHSCIGSSNGSCLKVRVYIPSIEFHTFHWTLRLEFSYKTVERYIGFLREFNVIADVFFSIASVTWLKRVLLKFAGSQLRQNKSLSKPGPSSWKTERGMTSLCGI